MYEHLILDRNAVDNTEDDSVDVLRDFGAYARNVRYNLQCEIQNFVGEKEKTTKNNDFGVFGAFILGFRV